jgi:hypothetical protein
MVREAGTKPETGGVVRTGADIQAAIVAKAMEAFDLSPALNPRELSRRAEFRRLIVEAADEIAMDIIASQRPSDEEAERAQAHEMRLRTDEACARMSDGEADCDCLDEPDESMDGDHASALESVYGPDDDAEDRF